MSESVGSSQRNELDFLDFVKCKVCKGNMNLKKTATTSVFFLVLKLAENSLIV